jgi:hypothetical protein
LPVYSIFMLTLHWKRFPFHAHLVLDNSVLKSSGSL